MLSDRRQQILCALIEEYVANACPVGSRTIAENHHLGVSPATIRNELSILEEAGYITQPHTSAGRIPTDAGYREFVDELLSDAALMQEFSQQIDVQEIRRHAQALDDLIEQTNAELARLTQCLSVIMAPRPVNMRIRQVSLVSLSDLSALVVLVTEDGQVANESIVFTEPITADDLSGIEGQLNLVLAGKAIDDIGSVGFMLEGRVKMEALTSIVSALSSASATLKRSRTTRSGMSTLMRKPEFHDSESLLPVMEILEDDTVLFKAINEDGEDAGDIRVRIGRENSTQQLFGVSVVAGVYGRGDAQGIVAVIGPTRMDYTRTIGAVRAAQDILKGE